MTPLRRPPPRPDSQSGHPELNTEQARQGASTGYMRRVLTISLMLGVMALAGAIAWFSGSSPNPHVTAPSAAARSG